MRGLYTCTDGAHSLLVNIFGALWLIKSLSHLPTSVFLVAWEQPQVIGKQVGVAVFL